MAQPLIDLTEEHKEMLMKYIKFFKIKNDHSVKEVNLAIKDIRDDKFTPFSQPFYRITGDLYSRAEVEEMFNKVTSEVSKTLANELDASTRMAAVFVQMVMNEAQKAGITLQAEVSYMENQHAFQYSNLNSKSLEELKSFEEGYTKIAKKGETKSKAGVGLARLPTLQGGYSNDPRILMELDEVKEQNAALKEKIRKLEEKMIEIAKTKGDIEIQKQEEEKLAKAGAETAESLKDKLEEKEKEVVKLKKEVEERISQSTQVASMKKIIQQKNDQINDLKNRLKKHEKVDQHPHTKELFII
eukprot:TRINITY_DN64514_c2_g1_i1.p3 TRINITY_DN64514_c2_g1~~TRINITY_DN64514_c2_g1_i1.p3  ORF type:complete len:300 (-),score=69.84 TRINITY_DN64514_c2_g1_i1:71-970(-)